MSEKKAEIADYLHLVHWVAHQVGRLVPQHVEHDDLFASGVRGLMKAHDRYDVERKAKFETYAILLIRGAIYDELRKLDWVPRSVRDRASRVASASERLTSELGREPDTAELADHLGLSIEEYEKLRLQIRPAIVLPLHEAPTVSDEQGEVVEERERHALLADAIRELSKQEQKVLVLYYYQGKTLKEIGKRLKVGESRVSQIHTKALARLKGILKERL